MRFIFAAVVSTVSATVDPCIQLCLLDPICDADRHDSYCKTWQEPQTCFAYYFNSPSKADGFYYHTEGDVRSEETPLLCVEAEAMIEDIDYCHLLCGVDPDCSRLGRSSYRKIDHDPVTCYSFIINEADERGFSYWNDEGDDSVPMTPEAARVFYERHMANIAE